MYKGGIVIVPAVPKSDLELITACLQGDQLAWDTLVDRYAELVYAIPQSHHFSADDADLIFEKVFARLLRDLSTVRSQAQLASWLMDVAETECERLQIQRRLP